MKRKIYESNWEAVKDLNEKLEFLNDEIIKKTKIKEQYLYKILEEDFNIEMGNVVVWVDGNEPNYAVCDYILKEKDNEIYIRVTKLKNDGDISKVQRDKPVSELRLVSKSFENFKKSIQRKREELAAREKEIVEV